MKNRCAWAEGGDELYIRYHDEEWSVPVHDDQKLFEFIVLESAQAGLSWRTILNKREGYRKAFKQFNPQKVARMSDAELEQVLETAAIVRNRLKIFGTRKNALAFLGIQKEFGTFGTYLWSWTEKESFKIERRSQTLQSGVPQYAFEIAKDLKKRGFTFLGQTVCYAFLQAVGVVNDHEVSCFRYKECAKLQKTH